MGNLYPVRLKFEQGGLSRPPDYFGGFSAKGATIDGAAVNASGNRVVVLWRCRRRRGCRVDRCERLLVLAIRWDRAVVDSLVFIEENLPRPRQLRYG